MQEAFQKVVKIFQKTVQEHRNTDQQMAGESSFWPLPNCFYIHICSTPLFESFHNIGLDSRLAGSTFPKDYFKRVLFALSSLESGKGQRESHQSICH